MAEYKEYYDNGMIKVEGFVHNDLKQGKWVYYFKNGHKEKEIHYHNDRENGKFYRWYENGNIEIESELLDGKNSGCWKEYYENGRIKEIGRYVNDKYSPIDFWDEFGNKLLENGTGKKIEKFGTSEFDVYEQYYENGEFVKEVKINSTGYGGFTSNSMLG